MLKKEFFDRDSQVLAQSLLGKVIFSKYRNTWLKAMIIETEAYYLEDKASHASLGYTPKRRALFMPAGTIYMYYSRGKDSMNISAHGPGNAVLVKAGALYDDPEDLENAKMIALMRKLNPPSTRPLHKLCGGQTLLCSALNLKVKKWDQKTFDPEHLFIKDVGYRPKRIIKTVRLGIAPHRDPHLLYRFIDYDYATYCTDNPLRKKLWKINKNYFIEEGVESIKF